MKAIQAYLTFNGNCREAMNFYTDALDADLQIMDAEGAPGVAEEHADKVLHARLQDTFFEALKEGGAVDMPLQDVFWGARFGILTDKFGVKWMFNFDYGKH